MSLIRYPHCYTYPFPSSSQVSSTFSYSIDKQDCRPLRSRLRFGALFRMSGIYGIIESLTTHLPTRNHLARTPDYHSRRSCDRCGNRKISFFVYIGIDPLCVPEHLITLATWRDVLEDQIRKRQRSPANDMPQSIDLRATAVQRSVDPRPVWQTLSALDEDQIRRRSRIFSHAYPEFLAPVPFRARHRLSFLPWKFDRPYRRPIQS